MIKWSYLLLIVSCCSVSLHAVVGDRPEVFARVRWMNSQYFNNTLTGLDILAKEASNIFNNIAAYKPGTLTRAMVSNVHFIPFSKLAKEHELFATLQARVELLDQAYAGNNKSLIQTQYQSLLEAIGACKQEVVYQQKFYLADKQKEENKAPASRRNPNTDDNKKEEPESLLKKLEKLQKDKNKQEEWSFGGLIGSGLSWMMEHPWQTLLGGFTLYIIYKRLTGGWPFNDAPQPSAPPAAVPQQVSVPVPVVGGNGQQ